MTVDHITSDIEIVPAQRFRGAGSLRQHVANMADAKIFADAVCGTSYVPAAFRGKPEDAAAAILMGMELGLEPMQSLQNIFVIGGRPAMFARTAVALLNGHGIVVQTVSSSDESVTVSATDPRTGQVEVSTWDLGRASNAGYTANKKYQTDPQAMLYAKAAMEVCRKIAPDVLLGIAYAREELELETKVAPRMIMSNRVGVDGLRAAIAPVVEPEIVGDEIEDDEDDAEEELPAAAKAMTAPTRKKWEKALLTALTEAECTDFADCEVVIADLAGRADPVSAESITDDELREAVGKLDAARKAGILTDLVNDILNIAALRSELA